MRVGSDRASGNNAISIVPLLYIGEIVPGALLSDVIFMALKKQELALLENDILVVTQKIVSKAEGRMVNLKEVIPSEFAERYAGQYKKDPSHIELILRESRRIVRMDHGVIIAETKNGFICANAGVDESNVGNRGDVTLLPLDPDKTAQQLQRQLSQQQKLARLGVIISDTWGRPWREGQVNFAIGVYGFPPLIDYRGRKDMYGFKLNVSLIAVADELASAAELVMGKLRSVPAALIRGYQFEHSETTGKALLRDPALDMFR